MSQIFKNSKVETIDLESSESDFMNFYGRQNKIEKFINDRNNLLRKSENITFKELNSVKLTFYDRKFDLIWIDGAHGYPVCLLTLLTLWNF